MTKISSPVEIVTDDKKTVFPVRMIIRPSANDREIGNGQEKGHQLGIADIAVGTETKETAATAREIIVTIHAIAKGLVGVLR